jgi:formylglycine-generating enzyme required for sulfatase activity
MVEVPSGSFVMAAMRTIRRSLPHTKTMARAFVIDQHLLTNAELRRFVPMTSHRATAETPTAEDFPGADAADLVAGTLVFRATDEPAPVDDPRPWWYRPGANWLAGSRRAGERARREKSGTRFVPVSYEDALAYAGWAGEQLLTVIEWEYAARAGGPPTMYAQEDEFMPRTIDNNIK